MAYVLLVDQADGWVDRPKVRARVDGILEAASAPGGFNEGPQAQAAEAAMLALAGATP